MNTQRDAEASCYDAWADYYDEADADRGPFLSFYAGLLTDRTRSILDVGCGSGIVTSALSDQMKQRGVSCRVVGLDRSAGMLEVARARDPTVEWVLGDLRELPVSGPFDLVVSCYNTFQHMLRDEDLARAFAAVRALMTPDSVFAFDIYQPNQAYLDSRPEMNRLARAVTDRKGRRLELREDTAYDRRSQLLDVNWRLIDVAHPTEPLARMQYDMRQFSADVVDRLLAQAGLVVKQRYGDLQKAPFDPTSKKQIVICAAG